jgi:DNA (cytosine-5)-methyltransferase 1
MKYGSVCSGIEAATMAWEQLGWRPQWFSEIETFPSAVLAHHYPDVPNLGDMTKLNQNPIFNETTIDVLVGGTPCQSFSVAGLRKGMEDPRGNLALEFCRLAYLKKPKWIVWENVPGVLSSNGGKDFGSLLGALGELGYGFAYRVLDAQHFGVPQRRRRVFLVGHLGDWRPAAAVLFESESLCRYNKESGSKGKTTTSKTEASPLAGKGYLGSEEKTFTIATSPDQWLFTNERKQDSHTESEPIINISPTITTSKGSRGGCSMEAIDEIKAVFYNDEKNKTRWSPPNDSEQIGALLARDYKGFANQDIQDGRGLVVKSVAVDVYNMSINEQTSQTLSSSASDINHTGGTITNARVRRLTPVECERLQGFPDNFTNVTYRNKPESPDGPRYKALGNSMAVPVMAWIGKRIHETQKILDEINQTNEVH